jgi:hypothetical protein
LKPSLKHLCCIISNGLLILCKTNPITPNSTETNPNTPNLTQTQPPIPVTQLSSFAQSITKLHKDNFMRWRGLVEPFLKGHDLYGFIDGTNTPPSPQVSTSPNGTLTVSTDPDTLWWLRQDQLILSMLMSSISDDMLPQVLGCKTAQELWKTLDRTFTSESQARVLNLRLQLTTAKKGNLSVSEHFHKIKHISATLAAAGHPVSDFEFTAYLLVGLGPEYDPFVTSVTTRVEPLSMDTLFGHLLAHESRIAQHHQSDSLFPTANIAARSPNPHRGRDNHKSFPRSSGQGFRSRGRAYQNYVSASRSQGGHTSHSLHSCPNPSMGPPRSSPHMGFRSTCQVSGKMGHSALTCYHRFNQAYQASGPNLTAYTAASSHSRDLNWYPETGATHHITSDLNNLSLSEAYDGPDEIQVGNGTRLAIQNTGISKLSPKFILRHILHVPKITKNLLSVQKFTADNNVSMEFHPSCFFVKDRMSGKILHHGPSRNGLYHWFPPSAAPPSVFLSERATFVDWHARLGHLADRIVRHVVSNFNLSATSNKKPIICPACQRGKSHQLPFSLSENKSNVPLELVFSNVWGPSPLLSNNGARYYVIFVDHFSKFTWFYPITCKSDVFSIFPKFQAYVERLFDRKIKSIQTDGGGEFQKLRHLFASHGINHRITCPHTHQQNGSVERKHRHIVEMGLTLMAHCSAPLTYWAEAFQTACYLINRLPTPVLNNTSPFQKLFNLRPNYNFMRVFGCACWPHLRPYNKHKLDFRSDTCIFIGYSPSHRGYQCLHPSTGRVYISRNVIFDESSFPFASISTSAPMSPSPSQTTLFPPLLPHTPKATCHPCLPIREDPTSSPIRLPPHPTSPASNTTNTIFSPLQVLPECPDAPPMLPPSQHSMQTRSKNNIFKPKTLPEGLIRYPLPKALIAITDSDDIEPTSYTTASKHPAWRDAMNIEFDALLSNDTWTLVPPTSDMNVVGCKWVFRLKRKADGSIDRHKARLVAKGFHQQPGIDFGETYSPVVKPTTICLVLSLAISAGWLVRQIDVHNAFLHGWLSEDVYMTQPPGFIHPQFPHHICKLHKALYGLKQAPRAWFSRLSDHLLELGFIGSHSDSSLFIRRTPSEITYVLIYVDDILITSSLPQVTDSLLQSLRADFAIKDLGPLHYFLGMEATFTSDGIILLQQRYILDLLRKSNMLEAKPVKTPMSTAHALTLLSGDTLTDPSPYRSLVGALQYLSLT